MAGVGLCLPLHHKYIYHHLYFQFIPGGGFEMEEYRHERLQAQRLLPQDPRPVLRAEVVRPGWREQNHRTDGRPVSCSMIQTLPRLLI